MKRPLHYILLLTGVLLLASCDPQTCGLYLIENQSTGVVVVNRGTIDPVTLAPGGREQIGPVCRLGDAALSPTSVVTSESKLMRDTVLCKKDIREERNWTTTKQGKYDYEHRFTVTDADF